VICLSTMDSLLSATVSVTFSRIFTLHFIEPLRNRSLRHHRLLSIHHTRNSYKCLILTKWNHGWGCADGFATPKQHYWYFFNAHFHSNALKHDSIFP
jgi:hypothetical protein